MDNCIKYVNRGIYLRIVITFIAFFIINKYHLDNKYLLIILSLVLLLLDFTDNLFTITKRNCHYIYYYKINDKINDLLSYLLVYLLFPLNRVYLMFIIYRAIGILLFVITKNSVWFVIMPDLLKEYLIYTYIYKSNNIYLPILILCKVIFEYFKKLYDISSFHKNNLDKYNKI